MIREDDSEGEFDTQVETHVHLHKPSQHVRPTSARPQVRPP